MSLGFMEIQMILEMICIFFYKVVWNKDLCCWWLSDIYTQEDEYLYICLKGIDVIGNIFDNKELLESEERL